MKYEMVDADTYDHVGYVNTAVLRMDLGLTQNQLYSFLDQGKKYKNCYLVEDEELGRLEETFDIYTMFRASSSKGEELRWSITREGKVLKFCNNEFQKELKPYKHHNSFVVAIAWTPKKNVHKKKTLNVPREYAKSFLALNEKNIVLYHGSYKKFEPDQVEIVDGHKFRSENNGWWLRNKPIGLYEKGKLIKEYRSAKDAADDLYISRETSRSYAMNEFEKRLFELDLRYIDDQEEIYERDRK